MARLKLGYTSSNGVIDDGKYNYTFESKVFSTNETLALGQYNWTLAGDGEYWSYNSTKGQQFGKSTAPYSTMTLTSDSIDKVKTIKINTSGANDISASLKVTVGGIQIGSTVSLTNTATEYTFETNNNLSGEVVLSYSQTSSKAIYIKSISIDRNVDVDENAYEVTSAKIGFGTIFSEEGYSSSATYGVLVLPTTSVGVNKIADYTDGCASINELKTVLKANGMSSLNYACTPQKVDKDGNEDENGSYYQYGIYFNGALDNLDNSLTAVNYMELDGKVYITSQTSYSLRSLCQGYLDNNIMADNKIATALLNYVVNYEVN